MSVSVSMSVPSNLSLNATQDTRSSKSLYASDTSHSPHYCFVLLFKKTKVFPHNIPAIRPLSKLLWDFLFITVIKPAQKTKTQVVKYSKKGAIKLQLFCPMRVPPPARTSVTSLAGARSHARSQNNPRSHVICKVVIVSTSAYASNARGATSHHMTGRESPRTASFVRRRIRAGFSTPDAPTVISRQPADDADDIP